MDQSICTVDTCERPIKNKTHGLCDPHYKRLWRYGDVQAHVPLADPRAKHPPVVDLPDGNRQCRTCGTIKRIDEYHRDASGPGGRRAECVLCRRRQEAARHHANKEHNNARSRNYRLLNLDDLRQKERQRYEDNRAERIAQATAAVHARRAKLATRPHDKGVTVLSLRHRDGTRCHYCGTEMVFGQFPKGHRPHNLATLEHKTPVSRGGAHTWDNCVLSCWRCNISKSNRSYDEWTQHIGQTQRTPPAKDAGAHRRH